MFYKKSLSPKKIHFFTLGGICPRYETLAYCILHIAYCGWGEDEAGGCCLPHCPHQGKGTLGHQQGSGPQLNVLLLISGYIHNSSDPSASDCICGINCGRKQNCNAIEQAHYMFLTFSVRCPSPSASDSLLSHGHLARLTLKSSQLKVLHTALLRCTYSFCFST